MSGSFIRTGVLLLLLTGMIAACSYNKENLMKSPSDKSSTLYPLSCDYGYTGVDSGQNNYTKSCHH